MSEAALDSRWQSVKDTYDEMEQTVLNFAILTNFMMEQMVEVKALMEIRRAELEDIIVEDIIHASA